MAKDPAFLFFPGDWLGGTMTFSRSHKGAYMDLLMCQFNGGHMSLQDVRTVLGDKDFEEMWESKLKRKFKTDENGLFYNQKLENEIIKRKKFTASRTKNLQSEPTHMDSHMKSHMASHMENENGNGDIKEIGSEKVKEVANEVWKDQAWKESICMGLTLTMGELKKWLAMFNSSVASDPIADFNKGKYKKMSRGWISSQKAKGVTVETGAQKKSDSAPLITIHGN